MNRAAQILVLVVALAVIGLGITQLASNRVRIGLAIVTIGVLFVSATAILLVAGRSGSTLAGAPGHGLVLSPAQHLLHDYVPGVAGATSYELDVYGTERPSRQLAVQLGTRLADLGYRTSAITPGPIFGHGNAAAVAQFDLDRWRWRVYELPLPTRFAGVNYSASDFGRLVAVTLSNDGS